MVKSDKEFRADLKRSQTAVICVAAHMLRAGLEIHIPEVSVTPSWEERAEHVDDYDLCAKLPLEDDWRPIQVKWRKEPFDSLEEFRYQNVIVDEQYKINKQLEQPPLGYFIVNLHLTGAIYIPWRTKDEWTTKTSFDRWQKRTCTWAMCHKDHCQWKDFLGVAERN